MASTEKSVKLTKAQAELLALAGSPPEERGGRFIRPGTDCVPYYKPAQKLVERGLARWLRDDASTHRLVATEAGRRALAQSEGE